MENKYHITTKSKLKKSIHIKSKQIANHQHKDQKKSNQLEQWYRQQSMIGDSGYKFKHNVERQGSVYKNYHEQYHRIQQNSRMMSRIMQPKRDKIIAKSLQCLQKKIVVQSYFNRSRTVHVKRTRKLVRTPIKNKPVQFSQNRQNYQQNIRMARRIINARSCIQTGSPRSRNKKRFFINQGVKSFFQQNNTKRIISQQNKQNKQYKQHKQHRKSQAANIICQSSRVDSKFMCHALLKPFYGFGPTILEINAFQLFTNPSIKDYDLISMQLLIDPTIGKQIKKVRNQKLKTYATNHTYIVHAVNYAILKKYPIKFAIRVKSIGEYVPLRIWKFQGLNSIEIGTTDLHFGNYLDTINRDSTNSQPKYKHITYEKYSGHFRKSKTTECQDQISINYTIYSKKYG